MYEGGYDGELPENPWATTDPFDAYSAGGALKDKTCGEMARYMGRLVGWYTNGGMHSHWRDCHFDGALFPSLLKYPLKVEGGAAE